MNKNIGVKHDKDKKVFTGDEGAENRLKLKQLASIYECKQHILNAVWYLIKHKEFPKSQLPIENFNWLLDTAGISKHQIHLAFIALIRHGAKKYGIGNWRKVPNAIERYTNALCRHTEEWVLADDVNCLDKDSGLPVYAHIIANCIFLSKLLRGKE